MGTAIILFVSFIAIVFLVLYLLKPKTKKHMDKKSLEKKVREQMIADKITRPMSDYERTEFEKIRKSVYGASGLKEERKFEAQAERNLIGIELEKSGRVDEAIPLYEQNVKENFIGGGPYKRLAIIYRSRKQYDDEIRILKKATLKFAGVDDYSKRLEKAKALKARAEMERKPDNKG
jgi:tetratricopeptide (TPR) repeat protein